MKNNRTVEKARILKEAALYERLIQTMNLKSRTNDNRNCNFNKERNQSGTYKKEYLIDSSIINRKIYRQESKKIDLICLKRQQNEKEDVNAIERKEIFLEKIRRICGSTPTGSHEIKK